MEASTQRSTSQRRQQLRCPCRIISVLLVVGLASCSVAAFDDMISNSYKGGSERTRNEQVRATATTATKRSISFGSPSSSKFPLSLSPLPYPDNEKISAQQQQQQDSTKRNLGRQEGGGSFTTTSSSTSSTTSTRQRQRQQQESSALNLDCIGQDVVISKTYDDNNDGNSLLSPCRHASNADQREVDDAATTSSSNTTTSNATAATTNHNNTVHVSLSLALPPTWNLSSSSNHQAVNSLLAEVSMAVADVFHSTLDQAITMLDESPTNTTNPMVVDLQNDSDNEDNGGTDGDVGDNGNDKPTTAPGGTPDSQVSYDDDSKSSYHDDQAFTDVNSTSSNHEAAATYNNNTADTGVDDSADNMEDMDDTLMSDMMALVAGSVFAGGTTNNDTATNALWEWLEDTPGLTKEDLYYMVLDYLDVAETDEMDSADEMTGSKGSSSSLLNDLKAEIRQAVYVFFFGHDNNDDNSSSSSGGTGNSHGANGKYTGKDADGKPNKDPSKNATHAASTNNTNNGNVTPTDTTTDHDVSTSDNTDGKDSSSSSSSSPSSGLWEMFLADTIIQLVDMEDDYVWWKVTMIYPVYLHYQVVHMVNPDLTTMFDNGNHSSNEGYMYDVGNATNTSSSSSSSAPSSSSFVESYYAPVEDQGTLDFIGRLLQQVLEAAVLSGAFLASLKDLIIEGGSSVDDQLVNHILGLAVPGSEYPLAVPSSTQLYDGDDANDPPQAEIDIYIGDDDLGNEKGRHWEEGTYPHSLLDNNVDGEKTYRDHRQQLGFWLLLGTCGGVAAIVLLAMLRTAADRKAQEEAWLLGSDQGVARILRVGWMQYSVPTSKDLSLSPDQFLVKRQDTPETDDDNHVEGSSEIIEIYDKSRAGYYDNDSMLHGSAMVEQQSICYESDAEKLEEPEGGGGFNDRPKNSSWKLHIASGKV